MAQITVEETVLDGISRLDDDISDAKSRVAEAQSRLDDELRTLARLQAMRENVMPFIQEYVSDEARRSHDEAEAEAATPFIDEVVDLFRQRPNETMTVDEAFDILRETGSDASRDRVRNALNYGVRLGKLERGAKRGLFTLKSTSAPAATGADVNENPFTGFSGEIGGGRDEASTPPHDQNGSARRVANPFDRVGDRAPIGS